MKLTGIHLLALIPLLPACAADSPVATGASVQFVLCEGGDDVCAEPEDGAEPDPSPEPPPDLNLECAVFMIRDVRVDGPQLSFDERIWEPVDLFDPATSAINFLDIETGAYDRVEFKVEPEEGFLEGPTGRKVSTFLCGTQDGVYFEYRDDTYETIELRDDAGIEVVSGEIAELAVTFDVASWLSGTDLSALDADDDGVVYIDEEHNHDAQNDIRDRIRDSIDLLRLD